MESTLFGLLILGFVSGVYSDKSCGKACCYSEEKHLDCSFAGLATTGIPDIFPDDVITIDLCCNGIREVRSRAFYNLTELTTIDLTWNYINTIRIEAFAILPKIRYVFFNHNNIDESSVTPGSFHQLSSLEGLDVSDNRLGLTVFPFLALKEMPNLKLIGFSAFEEFRLKDFINSVPFIQQIWMTLPACCYTLQNITFSGVNTNNVTAFGVKVTQIEHGFLCPLLNIKELHISILPVADIVDDILKSLKCLENTKLSILKIERNEIPLKLDSQVLRPLSKLCIKHLILSNNAIYHIDVISFQEFVITSQCLEELDLSLNPIFNGNFFWFPLTVMLKNVRILKFSQDQQTIGLTNNCNLYQCIQSDEFHVNLPPLIEVLIYKNFGSKIHVFSIVATGGDHLEVVDLSYVPVCSCDITVPGVPNLRYLDISGWIFLSVKNNFLRSFPKLLQFKSESSFLGEGLKYNTNIKEFFKYSTNLKHISLHGNSLQNLPREFFYPIQESLSFLNLSNNKFTDIPLDVQKFRSLATLDLRQNMIQTLSTTERQALGQSVNVEIYLSDNPFICTCDSLEFLLWPNISSITDYSDMACTTESGQSVLLIDFLDTVKEFEQHCVNRKWIIFGSIISVFIVITVTIGMVYYKFKYDLQYWYFIFKKQSRRKKPSVEIQQFMYDAFIAYCHGDWDEIRPIIKILEVEKLNISFDEKSFLVGKPIADNIIETIDDSKKVIFFVTEKFLRSEWGSYEIEMARIHAIRNFEKHSIIVVIKEDIVKENLPNALKNIWRKIICLDWPENGNAVRTKLFHGKLIDSLKYD